MTPLVALWALGCGDGIVAVDDDGTSGGQSSTSEPGPGSSTGLSDGSTSHGEPEFGSSTSGGLDSSDASDSSGTTVGRPGSARFLATRFFDNLPREMRLYTYRDGAITEELLATAPEGATVSDLTVLDSNGVAAYCIRGPEIQDSCHAIDLREESPSEPQPLGGENVPADALFLNLLDLDDTRVFLRAVDDDGFALYTVSLDGESPGEAELVWDNPSSGGTTVSNDRSFLLATADDGMGGRAIYRASLDSPAPDDTPLVVEPPVGQPLPIASFDLLPDDDAILFDVDDTNFAGGEALYFATIDGPTPEPAIRVDDAELRELEDRVYGPEVAPDGRGFVYFLTNGIFGDMVYVDLSSGEPGDSMLVWQRDDGGAFFRNAWWSPNSRWLIFEAQDAEENSGLHVIDSTDLGLEPAALTGPFAGGQTMNATFDPDGEWFYFVAAVDTQWPQLYRVPMTEDGPGTPELLSDGKGFLSGEFIPSPQWDAAMFTQEGAETPRELFEVQLGVARPPEQLRINGDLGREEDVSFGADYSLSGTAIIHAVQVSGELPRTLRLYDRLLGETMSEAHGPDFLAQIERVRLLSKSARAGVERVPLEAIDLAPLGDLTGRDVLAELLDLLLELVARVLG